MVGPDLIGGVFVESLVECELVLEDVLVHFHSNLGLLDNNTVAVFHLNDIHVLYVEGYLHETIRFTTSPSLAGLRLHDPMLHIFDPEPRAHGTLSNQPRRHYDAHLLLLLVLCGSTVAFAHILECSHHEFRSKGEVGIRVLTSAQVAMIGLGERTWCCGGSGWAEANDR